MGLLYLGDRRYRGREFRTPGRGADAAIRLWAPVGNWDPGGYQPGRRVVRGRLREAPRQVSEKKYGLRPAKTLLEFHEARGKGAPRRECYGRGFFLPGGPPLHRKVGNSCCFITIVTLCLIWLVTYPGYIIEHITTRLCNSALRCVT